MRGLWMTLGLLSVILADGSATAHNSVGSGEPPKDEPALHIPFALHRGFAIVVRGSIGTAKNLNFLIDTGVSPSVVDRRVARRSTRPCRHRGAYR